MRTVHSGPATTVITLAVNRHKVTSLYGTGTPQDSLQVHELERPRLDCAAGLLLPPLSDGFSVHRRCFSVSDLMSDSSFLEEGARHYATSASAYSTLIGIPFDVRVKAVGEPLTQLKSQTNSSE